MAMEGKGLFFGHGTHSIEEDAIVLVKHALKLSSADGRGDSLDISNHYDTVLNDEQWAAVGAAVQQRVQQRLPSAYITGEAWLGGLPFHVSKDVIVPRSFIMEVLTDTVPRRGAKKQQQQQEEQQEAAAVDSDASDGDHNDHDNGRDATAAGTRDPNDPHHIPSTLQRWLGRHQVTRALDMCTGSGCLAVLLARAFPAATIDAVDVSPEALALARRNIERHNLGHRIETHLSDMFAAPSLHGRQYDLIVANPPYVASSERESLPAEFQHEPDIALFGSGLSGLGHIDRLVREAPDFLHKRGVLICEAAERRKDLHARHPALRLQWLRTSAGYDRVFLATARWLQSYRRQSALAAFTHRR